MAPRLFDMHALEALPFRNKVIDKVPTTRVPCG
jgi:hypothetical protein